MQQNRLTNLVGFIIGLGLVAGGAFAYINSNTATVAPTSQVSAEAMPPNTLFYATVDIFNLLDPAKLTRIARAFAPFYQQSDITASTEEEAIATIDSQFAELGLTFRTDIQPWIGRSVGAGILDFELQDEELVPTDYVIAAEIRDQTEAAAFLTKLIANYPAAYDGKPLEQQLYQDVAMLVESSADPPFAISQSETLMLIASDAVLLQQAIDAQQGASLFTQFGYTAAVAKLPAERPITVYVAGSAFGRILTEFSASLDSIGLSDAMRIAAQTRLQQLHDSLPERAIGAIVGVAGTLGLGDEGLQFDVASVYDAETISAEQKSLLQKEPPPLQAGLMPQDTVFYLSSGGLAQLWETNRNLLLGVDSDDDAEDAMLLMEQQTGFNLERDFISQLTGGMALGVYPASDGLFAMMNGTQTGMVLTQDVADGAAIAQPVDQIGSALTGLLAVPVKQVEDYYSVAFLGTELAAYGVVDNGFVFSTHSENLRQPPQILSGSAEFQEAMLAIPANMTLTGWLSVDGLASTFGSETPVALQNIPMAAWGMGTDETGGVARFILFFE